MKTMTPHAARTSHRITRHLLTAISAAAIFVARPAAAQIVIGGGQGQTIDMSGALGDMISKAFSQALDFTTRTVTLSPALVTVDPQTHMATVVFTNPGNDTLNADIVIGDTPPVPMSLNQSNPDVSALIVSDSASKGADTASTNSTNSVAAHSLKSWVTGVPTKMTLAPHEKRSVTVTLNAPAAAPSGEYTAWIIATTTVDTSSGGGMHIVITGQDGKGLSVQSGSKLVYQAK